MTFPSYLWSCQLHLSMNLFAFMCQEEGKQRAQSVIQTAFLILPSEKSLATKNLVKKKYTSIQLSNWWH